MENQLVPLSSGKKPKHVAIIMDGNNRWAKQQGKSGIFGHRSGVSAVRAVVETCANNDVEVLTLFAFSSENWRRPVEEVSALMKLFLTALQREVKKLHKNNIRLRVIGDRSRFSALLNEHIEKAELLTENNDHMTLVIAANYGGRWDILEAAKSLAQKVERGELSSREFTEELLHSQTQLADLPAPDLMIRTAGEKRISNFMIWQLAYTEFYFSELYWPDFKHEQMERALLAYADRKRRFGQTDEQLDVQSDGTSEAMNVQSNQD